MQNVRPGVLVEGVPEDRPHDTGDGSSVRHKPWRHGELSACSNVVQRSMHPPELRTVWNLSESQLGELRHNLWYTSLSVPSTR